MPRHYGPAAQKSVERAMKRRNEGKLKSGKSGRTVRSRKQAIAIGLSEAREKGAKVPDQPVNGRARTKSSRGHSASRARTSSRRGRRTARRSHSTSTRSRGHARAH
jgi:hypothetical protein